MTTTQRPYDGYAPFDDDLTDYARPQDFRVRRVPRALCAWIAAAGIVGVAVLWSHVIAPWIAGWWA